MILYEVSKKFQNLGIERGDVLVVRRLLSNGRIHQKVGRGSFGIRAKLKEGCTPEEWLKTKLSKGWEQKEKV